MQRKPLESVLRAVVYNSALRAPKIPLFTCPVKSKPTIGRSCLLVSLRAVPAAQTLCVSHSKDVHDGATTHLICHADSFWVDAFLTKTCGARYGTTSPRTQPPLIGAMSIAMSGYCWDNGY